MLRRQPRDDAACSSVLPSGFGEWDTAAPDDPRQPVLHHLRQLMLRLGAVKSTLLVALVAALASVGITVLVNTLFPPPRDMVAFTIALSLGIPLAIATPVAWFIVLLMLEAESARGVAERLAMTDPLTRTFNRRHFFRVGERTLARTQLGRETLSVLLLDIDHFKTVNDRHGHACGDRVLNEVAATCKASLRKGDMLARFGGEEFVVLLPDTETVTARGVAEQMRTAVERLCIEVGNGTTVSPTVSIGVASTRGAETTLDKLLVEADQAMYLAKRDGRNRVMSDNGKV